MNTLTLHLRIRETKLMLRIEELEERIRELETGAADNYARLQACKADIQACIDSDDGWYLEKALDR